MRTIALALAMSATLLGAPIALEAKARLTPQEKLDKMLEGRVAEKPVSCINTFTTRDLQIIDKTALVYGSGRVIYVNRPRHPQSLDSNDILVTVLHGSQLCRLDTVKLFDRSGVWFTGFVGLENFVPYRKVDVPYRKVDKAG